MQKYHIKIQDLHVQDRPREKLIKYGTDKLDNNELLALILRTGILGKSAIELAEEIMNLINKIGLEKIKREDLKKIKGIGDAKISEILAVLELGKRLFVGKKSSVVHTPTDIWYLLSDIRNSRKEHFVVFYLDSSNQEIKREIISIGTLNRSLVHPREVFELAIKYSSASIMLAHNHPSGSLEPSDNDLLVTEQLVASGEILDIHVLDHVIVSNEGWFSMRDEGYMGEGG